MGCTLVGASHGVVSKPSVFGRDMVPMQTEAAARNADVMATIR